MKTCPACGRRGESDTTRYCGGCGTELFSEERMAGINTAADTPMLMLYFSGTGNSKYVAELFGKKMNARCHSIEDAVDFGAAIDAADTVGFCYPIYGSRVPRVMREFVVKHADALKTKRLIILCTQLIFSGDGARALLDSFTHGCAELLDTIKPRVKSVLHASKQFDVVYAEHFYMPNNVCNVFFLWLSGEKRMRRCMRNADKKLTKVCRDISGGVVKRRGFNAVSIALGSLQGRLMAKYEPRWAKYVWVDDACTRCMQCVSLCPARNLAESGGKIIHYNNCAMCYRCINMCPERAIYVFFKRRTRRQYKGLPLL